MTFLSTPKVSVIVPCYNVEKYIEKSILSIINQTYNNLEIILVNDGSPDNCLSIMRKYEKLDDRIKVVDKQNGGHSSARNAGLRCKTGEYVTFVDSDDFLTPDHIETLLKNITESNADLSITQFKKVYENKKIKNLKKCNKVHIINNQTMLDYVLSNNNLSFGVWNKLYKSSLIDGLFFNENIKFEEDLPFIFNYVLRCKSVCYSSKQTYMYLQRQFSTLKSFNSDKYFTKYIFYKDLLSTYENDAVMLNKVQALLCLHNIEAMYYFYKYNYTNLENILKIHNYTTKNINKIKKFKSIALYKRMFAKLAYYFLSTKVIHKAKNFNQVKK